MKTLKVSVTLSEESIRKFDEFCKELTNYYNKSLCLLLSLPVLNKRPFYILSKNLTDVRPKDCSLARKYFERINSQLALGFHLVKIKKNKYYPKSKLVPFNSISGYLENIKFTEKGFKLSSIGEIFQVKNKTKKVLSIKKEIKVFCLKKTKHNTFELHLTYEDSTSTPKTSKNFKNFMGIDVGIKTLAVTSTGHYLNYSEKINKEEQKLVYINEKISRCKNDSINKENLVKKFQKLKKRIKDLKAIYLREKFESIIPENTLVAIESLDIKSLIHKNRKLAPKIILAGWKRLFSVVNTITTRKGGKVIKVPRFFPSSKTCSHCGSIKASLKLSDRTYVCSSCNSSIDRDLNAAINLENYAKNYLNNSKKTKSKKAVKSSEKTT